jgi:hypothetical protein
LGWLAEGYEKPVAWADSCGGRAAGMKQERDHRRWWLGAFALFLGLLGIWTLAVILLSPAGASSFDLNFGLGSRLRADYSADAVGRRVGVLRLSIVEDVLRDLGLTNEEAEAQRAEVEVAMSQAVPTATARTFGGEPPYTASPLPTATPPPSQTISPTETPVPTAMPTSTRRPTRTPTRTPRPSQTSGPSATPTGDTSAPVVGCCGYTLVPTPGPIPSCSVSFSIYNVHVTDAAGSSGIEWVRFKYDIVSDGDRYYVPPYAYSADFNMSDGGAVDSAWDAHYYGYLTISIFPGWNSLLNYGPDDFHIHLWVKAHDNAGNEGVLSLGEYTISEDCDDPATPSATATRTSTATRTATATNTSTATPTATDTETPTATETPSPT